MAAPGLLNELTVEEYIRTSYRPDVDYIDGHIEERNFGEWDHGRIQGLLFAYFFSQEDAWNVGVVTGTRVQVKSTRFRVPDVSVVRRDHPIEQIIRRPPLVCIEVLSPEDTYTKMRARVLDYHQMGVQNVWILDPERREALVCTPLNWYQPEDGLLSVQGTPIEVRVADLFAKLGR